MGPAPSIVDSVDEPVFADRRNALFEHVDGDVGFFFGDNQRRADSNRPARLLSAPRARIL